MITRTNNRKFRYGLSLAIAVAAACSSRAMIPEPDTVIYGQVSQRFDQAMIPAHTGEITVIAQVNGVTLATTVLAPGKNTFLLRVPMDDGVDPRQPSTAKAGDEVHFFLRNNLTQVQIECVQSRSQAWVLPTGRGSVVPMNLSVDGNLAGTPRDSNRDGIPDFWYNHFNLTITSPTTGQRCTNVALTIQGTTGATGLLAGVWCQLNGGSWVPASSTDGYTNWMADVTLVTPGTNWIKAYAMDAMGSCSPTNQKSFIYAVPSLLTVQVSGEGTLSTNYNGQFLDIARNYSMTAIPGHGYVFSNWVGGVGLPLAVLSDKAKLNFLMQNNLVLQANFIPNPFVSAKGTYTGLYYDSNNVQQGNSGFFTLTVTEKGAYSGNIRFGIHRYSMSGQLSVDGTATKVIGLATDRMTVNLALDLADGTRLSGSISNGSWLAELRANRAVFNAVTHPATNFAGKYTLIVPGADDNDFYPEGDGYATVIVDNAGTVRMSGLLADGRVMVQTASVSRDGQWPLYVPLYYAGQGSVLGWMTFTNSPDDLTGWMRWIDPAQPTARVYRDGFTNVIPGVVGSRYTPVGSTNNVLNLTNCLVVFEGGNLATAFTNEVVLKSGKVTNTSPNFLAMTFTKTTGKFTGTVTVPGSSQSYSFKGAVLTNLNIGSGYFLGTNQTGRVFITAP